MKTPMQLMEEVINAIEISQSDEALATLRKIIEIKVKQEKQVIVDAYLTAKMKGHNLSYGIDYFALRDESEIEAKQYYKETFEI